MSLGSMVITMKEKIQFREHYRVSLFDEYYGEAPPKN